SPGRGLLGEHRRLDPVEETLEPSDQLSLRDPDLRLRRNAVHRRSERRELLLQVVGEHVAKLTHRTVVDLSEAAATRFVYRSSSGLLQQLPDHRSDAQELRWFGDGLRAGGLAFLLRDLNELWLRVRVDPPNLASE